MPYDSFEDIARDLRDLGAARRAEGERLLQSPRCPRSEFHPTHVVAEYAIVTEYATETTFYCHTCQELKTESKNDAFELQKWLIQQRGWYPTAEEITGLLRAYAMRQLLLQEEWRS